MRPLLALLLALTLTLTAQSMAVARGMAMPAGTVVLCTGAGAVSVAVDQDGQPTGPAHYCPDCAMTEFAVVAPGVVSLVNPGVAQMARFAPLLVADAPTQVIPPASRDPPALV